MRAPARGLALLVLAMGMILVGSGCKSEECICERFGSPTVDLGGYDGGEIISANDPNPCEIDVDFGTLGVGLSATAFIQIGNTGAAALDTSQVNPTLDPEFGLSYGPQEPIQPGTSSEFTLTFQPYKVGQVSSTFTIQTDGINSECPAPTGTSAGDLLTVVLAGTGS